jgi:hypothetical protein
VIDLINEAAPHILIETKSNEQIVVAKASELNLMNHLKQMKDYLPP